MTQKTTNSFLKGALILAIANIIVKVIGMVFRVPLTNIVGDYTMGLYSVAYKYYAILLTIATAGLPIAISKMISESNALGRYHESKRIFHIALLSCAALGLIGMSFLLVFATPLANLSNDVNAAMSIMTLAPAVLFIAIAAAFRGYFQGHNRMAPTALSQVIEALSRLFIGLFVASLLLKFSKASNLVSAGAVSGITFGTGAAALILFIISLVLKKKMRPPEGSDKTNIRTRGQIFKSLMYIALPVTVGALVINLTSSIDMFLITNRLAVLGYAAEETTSLFGIYDNYAVPLFNLLPSIIISLNVSITPVIAAAHARGNYDGMLSVLLSATRLVVMIALPAAIGISVLANPILSLLYHVKDSVAIATPVLSIMSIASIFLCLSSLTSTVLQALGKPIVPVITMVAGALVKIASNYFLIVIPGVELNGAALGTVLCYAVITILNLFYLSRFIGFKPSFSKTYMRPLAATAIMGAVCYLLFEFISPVIGGVAALGASIVVGGGVYIVLLVAFRGVTRADVLLLPKGEKLANLLRLK
ncbi:MAG: polysaccharide biosynthesis protein [Clostridia bacterium]